MVTFNKTHKYRSERPMTSAPAFGQKDSWQAKRWVHVLAILISVVPMYAALIIYHLSSLGLTNSMEGFFAYLTINGSISITLIYLLQRFLIGERFWDLNRKPAKWG